MPGLRLKTADSEVGMMGGLASTTTGLPAPSATTSYFNTDTHKHVILLSTGRAVRIDHELNNAPRRESEFWNQWDSSGNSNSTNAVQNDLYYRLFDKVANKDIMRLIHNANGHWVKAQYHNGTTWVDFSGNIINRTGGSGYSGQYRTSVKIKLHATDGHFIVYHNGAEVARFEGVGGDGNTILNGTDKATSYEVWSNGQAISSHGHAQSNFIYAEGIDPRAAQCAQRMIDGAGTENTMEEGDYTAIDEVIHGLGDSVYGNAGERIGFSFDDLPASMTGRPSILSIVMNASKGYSGGPENVRGGLRIGGVNYFAAAAALKESPMEPTYADFSEDPSSPGDPMTAGLINAAEGVVEFVA